MEPDPLEQFRRLLEGLRAELETRLVPGEAGGPPTAELQEVDAALQRLQEGTYGFCGECGEPIPLERLEAIPWATTCARCALVAETDIPE